MAGKVCAEHSGEMSICLGSGQRDGHSDTQLSVGMYSLW